LQNKKLVGVKTKIILFKTITKTTVYKLYVNILQQLSHEHLKLK